MSGRIRAADDFAEIKKRVHELTRRCASCGGPFVLCAAGCVKPALSVAGPTNPLCVKEGHDIGLSGLCTRCGMKPSPKYDFGAC